MAKVVDLLASLVEDYRQDLAEYLIKYQAGHLLYKIIMKHGTVKDDVPLTKEQ